MKVVIQRVNKASVHVNGELVAEIGKGLLLLVGFGEGDNEAKLKPMAEKICNLRIFQEGEKHFQTSLLETKGEILAVPQFTLYADTQKGRRPDFTKSLQPDLAQVLFQSFLESFFALGVANIRAGKFAAYMQVALENDGPVTILLEN